MQCVGRWQLARVDLGRRCLGGDGLVAGDLDRLHLVGLHLVGLDVVGLDVVGLDVVGLQLVGVVVVGLQLVGVQLVRFVVELRGVEYGAVGLR